MNGMISVIEKNIVPIAAKIGSQKHLMAIRDGFASTMPLVMAGAIAVLMNNVFFVPWGLLAGFIGADHPFIVWSNAYLAPIFSAIDSGSLSILALALCFSLGYKRAEFEKKDALSASLVTVGAYFVCGALSRNNPLVASYITHYLGAQGIFLALVIGMIAPEIYFWVVDKGWTIKMPEQVPPAVGKAFAAIIPGFITIFVWALVYYAVFMLTGSNVFQWFEDNISGALLNLGDNIVTIGLVSFLIPLFWFFGLHGANLMEAFMSPVYGTMGTMNLQNFANGITDANKLFPWVRASWDIYVFLGGSGATLALVLAIMMTSKVKQDREIAKLGLPCGIFMINEPVLFGLPVVLNPIYLIPFSICQPIMAIIGYVATTSGFAYPVVNSIPWTTPPILGAYLATNGSIGAVITSAACLGVAFVCYLPFAIAANRSGMKQEIKG